MEVREHSASRLVKEHCAVRGARVVDVLVVEHHSQANLLMKIHRLSRKNG